MLQKVQYNFIMFYNYSKNLKYNRHYLCNITYMQIICQTFNLQSYQQKLYYNFDLNLHSFIKQNIPIRQMIKKAKLSVSVHDVEFAKDYQYLITVQFQENKKSTDVSALASNPIFTNNTLIFDLPSNHTISGQIIFIASIVTQQFQGKISHKVLGQCSLDLTPFALQPTQTYNLPIRQQMKFFRSKEGKQITVGKFISSFKIVHEEDIPLYLEDLQTKKLQKNQYFVDLPDFDDQMDFAWRVRLDIRQALNIPNNDSITPQAFVQVGWTQFKDTLPEQSRIYSTGILNTNHPEWNQTFLIRNPPHLKTQKGFIMIQAKDNHNLDDIFRIYLPMESMAVFTPYNIKAVRNIDTDTSPIQLYFSAILQSPYNQKDKLHDIIIADITYQPAVAPFKNFHLVMVSDSQNQPKINFYPFNVKQDLIERIMQFDQTQQFSCIISQSMRIPPIKSNKQYKAATIMTISQNLLRKPLAFYIVGKVQKGKYKVAGIAQNVQKDLINLLIQKVKKRLFLSVRNHPNVKMGKCQIEISSKDQNKILGQSNVSSRKGQETASQKFMKDLNFTSNQSFLKHASQNNQIIARMLRQLDDKSESLRQAAAEISSLRGKVKLLQNQNSILKRNAIKQEDELVNLVQRQVENMSNRDLKDKIVKMSQLYKAQKSRTIELTRAISHLEPQVSNSMQLQSIISGQKNSITVLQQKIEKYKKDFERINIYKQTIKKQEKVIMKLETVMKDGMQQVRNARRYKLELEQIKKRGHDKPSNLYLSNGSNKDKQEIQRLQRIIVQLQQNTKLKNSTASSKTYGDSDPSVYELQFKLHQAETRIQSLEEELQQKSRSFARQLAMFKMKMAEKQAVLDGYNRY